MKTTLMISLVLAASAAPLAAQTPARAPLPNDSLAIARRYAAWIWSSQMDSLMAHRPAENRNTPSREETSAMLAQMNGRVGVELSVVEERWVRRNGDRQYWRIARFSDFTGEPVVLRLVIAPNGDLIGTGLNPLSRVPPVDPEP